MPKLDRLSGFDGVTPGLNLMDANRNFTKETYRVWACDNQVYGPVTWPVLAQWAAEGRVLRDTWIFLEAGHEWRPAHKIPPLHECFPPGETATLWGQQDAAEGGVAPEELRQ